MQEYLLGLNIGTIEDFHVNLADGKDIQAAAYGNKKDGYYIAVTKKMLIELGRYAQTASIPQEVFSIGLGDEDAFRKRLYKCLLMGVFFHEYGHIYNGDCDDPKRLPKKEKEAKADEFALAAFHRSCILQYRFGDSSPEEEMELLGKKVSLDMIAFSVSQQCLTDLRERENQ